MSKKRDRNKKGVLPKGWGYIYVVDGKDRTKIGMSLHPKTRVKSVKSASGLNQEVKHKIYGPVPSVKEQEKYLLDTLSNRIAGSEWFNHNYKFVCNFVDNNLLCWGLSYGWEQDRKKQQELHTKLKKVKIKKHNQKNKLHFGSKSYP